MDSKHLDLIIKDLTGEISSEEKKELWKWLPSNLEAYNEIKHLWENIEEKSPDFPIEKRWEELKLRIEGENEVKVRRINPVAKYAIAASFSLALIFSLFLFLNKKEVEAPLASTNIHQTDNLIQIFYLPDSSIVWLNKNSKLTVGDNFNEKERNVSLEGEAYFQVKPDATKPFFVYSGNTLTKVVGTSFNIAAYPGMNVSISVESGAVEFYNEEHSASKLFLWASDKAICDSRGGMELISGKESENLISHLKEREKDWKNDRTQIREDQQVLAEISNPSGYISNEFFHRDNRIREGKVEGKLINSSSFTSYKDVRVKAVYYSEDKKQMGVEYFDLPGNLLPGGSVNYSLILQNWFSEATNIDVEIEKARVVR